MPITEQQLLQILPNAGPRAGVFVGALNRGMTRFGITSPVRAAAFLAQVGHESGQLTRLVENLNYSARGLAATWPSRYLGADGQPNALAQRLARNPEPSPTTPTPRATAMATRRPAMAGATAGAGCYRSPAGRTTAPPAPGWASRWKRSRNYSSTRSGRRSRRPGGGLVTASMSWPTGASLPPSPAGSTAGSTARRSAWRCGSAQRRCCRDLVPCCLGRAGLPAAGRPRRRWRCLDRCAALPTAARCCSGGSDCLPRRPGRVGIRSGGAGPADCRVAPGQRAARPGCSPGVGAGTTAGRRAVCRGTAPAVPANRRRGVCGRRCGH